MEDRLYDELRHDVNDHDKAISTLVSSVQRITIAIEQIEKNHESVLRTLEKLSSIEKILVKYEIQKNDFERRVTKMEQAQEKEGCRVLTGHLQEIQNLKDRVKSLEENRKWVITGIFSGLGTAVLALILKN